MYVVNGMYVKHFNAPAVSAQVDQAPFYKLNPINSVILVFHRNLVKIFGLLAKRLSQTGDMR
jgi:hypothetical protein